jgi:hypothetical protein
VVNQLRSANIFDRATTTTDADGCFRAEAVTANQQFGVGFEVKGRIVNAGSKSRDMTITPGETKDLGEIKSKPYGE